MMNVVQSGSQYQIYGESLKTYNELPVRSYDVSFHKMMGFFLMARPNLEANEEKIYGNHRAKVKKVINSFNLSSRNFGIILSGQKGIGKSLFARLLAMDAIEAGLPVITVTEYVPGIANFLSSIEQQVVVIFDEFEKTFGKNDEMDPQEEMLSLFDGLDGGKKLFVITCNEINKLNSYLLDRPGRFHYHFRIGNPCDQEISEYMRDKLDEKYYDNIPRIINFSRTAEMTYDYLRAIAFDLNQGYSLEESLIDLNISSTTVAEFDIIVYFSNGDSYISMNEKLNLCRKDQHGTWLRKQSHESTAKRECIYARFYPTDAIAVNGELIIPPDKIELSRDREDDYELEKDEIKEKDRVFQERKVVKVVLEKCPSFTYNKERFLV